MKSISHRFFELSEDENKENLSQKKNPISATQQNRQVLRDITKEIKIIQELERIFQTN